MSTMVVLVVEDEPALVSIYQRALEQRGYKVLSAMTGEKALEIIEAEDGSIDLMLSDIVMPGMSGRELVWRVRETHPAIKIILASGYANEDGALQLMEDLGVIFIPKPVDLNDLMDVVQDSIGDPKE
ncbi:MAG TPA: response regulator [Longimicrobiaceae bacterium]|nr:response regulator [Longimicrobiaceae bacterium]